MRNQNEDNLHEITLIREISAMLVEKKLVLDALMSFFKFKVDIFSLEFTEPEVAKSKELQFIA